MLPEGVNYAPYHYPIPQVATNETPCYGLAPDMADNDPRQDRSSLHATVLGRTKQQLDARNISKDDKVAGMMITL